MFQISLLTSYVIGVVTCGLSLIVIHIIDNKLEDYDKRIFFKKYVRPDEAVIFSLFWPLILFIYIIVYTWNSFYNLLENLVNKLIGRGK